MAIPNTIECNTNASQKSVSTVYIIRSQFVGVNKPSHHAYRYHCAEGLAFHFFLYLFHNLTSLERTKNANTGVHYIRMRINVNRAPAK